MSSRRLAQGRQGNLDHVQPVIEIVAEGALLHHGRQVLVGGRHHADVHLDLLAAAHTLELPFLQNAQQLDLQVRRQLGDFVQKKRAAVGLLKTAPAHGHRAGERPLFMAEKLALEHAGVQGHAVHGHKGLVLARAGIMDGPGHQFLARA